MNFNQINYSIYMKLLHHKYIELIIYKILSINSNYN